MLPTIIFVKCKYFGIFQETYIPVKKYIDKKICWKEFTNEVKDIDLGVVCNFGYMIPSYLIDKFPMIVVHPSLLPKYRGAAPI